MGELEVSAARAATRVAAPRGEVATSRAPGLAAGVGRSLARDAATAGREAALAARAELGGEAVDFALVFATDGYAPEALLAAIADALPGARVSGCSAEGVIDGDRSHEVEHAVVVLAVRSARARFRPFLVEGYGADPARAGRAVAAACADPAAGPLAAVVVLPDGLCGDAGALLAAIEATLPAGTPILGGAAADAWCYERTTQFLDRRAVTGAVAGFAIHGDVAVRIAVSHGCAPIGRERVVTRASAGWVEEIDGRPAWQVFREYLDAQPDDLDPEGIVYLALALEVEDPSGDRTLVVRTPGELDRARGALFFAGGGLEVGTSVRLVRRDALLVGEGARAAAEQLARAAGDRPSIVLQFDCAGRGRLLFGERTDAITLAPMRAALGRDVPWVGFQTFGEIGPIGGRARFQNYTAVLCALHEVAR
jgi:hypothetical protein